MKPLLQPKSEMLCSGHAACPGCVEALSVRHILATLGPDTMAVIPPSCMAIIAGPQPFSSCASPSTSPRWKPARPPPRACGARSTRPGRRDTQVLVLAGDGGTYDIGFQCLSSAAERNENILYVCLDNEGYMNTGAQKSSSTPRFARTGSDTRRQDHAQEEPGGDHGRPPGALCRHRQHRPPVADLVRKVDKAKPHPRLQAASPCWCPASTAGA
jgi:pyruvate/2-oxoacid:ferredoxin oxidoreductase beta subunit